MRLPLFSLLMFCLPAMVSGTCGGHLWKASWVDKPRSDLHCILGVYCRNTTTPTKSEEYDTCCKCHSCAVWEGSELELFIEYASVLGGSLVLSDQAPRDTEVYKIEHQNADMTEIPSNLCNWDTESSLQDKYPDEFENIKPFWGKIVKINFENNKIKRLPNINCLVRLDEMNLRNNQLQHVSNTSFTNLRNLRSISMSGNQIKEIDPNILTSKSLHYLFYVDFSKNEMSKLDASNMFTLYPFCKIDYSSNEITDLVNEADFTMDMNKTYGPGYVGVADNKLSTWPDFEIIFGLNDITELGRLINFGFDFRGMSLVCDCNIQQFLEKAYNIINVLWRGYMNLTCSEPESVAGHLVWDIYEKEPESFVCPVEDGCDPRCTCVDEPKKNTSFIDCSNSDLQRLPEIPYSRFSYFVALNVSNNQISTIGNVSYLHRISILDISRNNLKEINKTIANRLENATYIDISNNPRLKQLPQMFQYHNVCSRHMKNLQISCDCHSKWIEKWVHSRSCNEFQNNLFQCEIPNIGIRRALDFNPEDLECSPEGFLFFLETIIAGVILSLVLIGILVYTFRYELLILCLRLRQKSRNIVVPLYEYDVFLSFNDADDDVDRWVNSILEPELTDTGYSVFQPNRDVAFGAERDSEIIDILSKTRNFLAIMSDSYLQESEDGMRSWTENEWKYGWNNFKTDRSKNIVLVNFDYLSSFDVNKPQIKAFLRVGCTVDFKNYDRKIMQQIFEKLGKPCRIPSLAVKTFDNKKVNFNKYDIFMVATTDVKLHSHMPNIDEEQVDIQFKRNVLLNPGHIECKPPENGQQKHNKTFKPVEQRKVCKHRKCYACNHGSTNKS